GRGGHRWPRHRDRPGRERRRMSLPLLVPALALPGAVSGGDPVTADFSNDVFWVWLLKAVAIAVFLLTSVLIAIWLERKVVARMQVRPGPNVHGPFGLLQSLADAMK